MPSSFKDSLGIEALDSALTALGDNPKLAHEKDWKAILSAIQIKADRFKSLAPESTLASPPPATNKDAYKYHASIIAGLQVLQEAMSQHSSFLSSHKAFPF